MQVPSEEARSGQRDPSSQGTALSTVQVTIPSLTQALYGGIAECNALGISVGRLARAALTREKLEVSVRALARVLRAVVGGDRNLCSLSPSVRYVELSVQLLLRISSASSREALDKGRSVKSGCGISGRSGLGAGTGSSRGTGQVVGDL